MNHLASGRSGRGRWLLVALAVAVGGCGMSVSQRSEQKLGGTEWLAEDIGGHGVLDRVQSTLAFSEDGRVSGNAGCNRLTGPVTIDGPRISFGAIATTRAMCPPAVMEQERRFLESLAATRRFEIAEGKLLLYGDGKDPLIRLSR